MLSEKLPRNWQRIILREWRNSEDGEYARHLFQLVAITPAGWGTVITAIILGTLFGTMIGLLMGLIVTHWEVRDQLEMWGLTWSVLLDFVWKGGSAGGTIGLLIGMRYKKRLRLQSWLTWLTPEVHSTTKGRGCGEYVGPWLGTQFGVQLIALSLVLTLVLFCGISAGVFTEEAITLVDGGIVFPSRNRIHGMGDGLVVWLVFVLVAGLVGGLAGGLTNGLANTLSNALVLGLVGGLLFVLTTVVAFTLAFVIFGGLSSGLGDILFSGLLCVLAIWLVATALIAALGVEWPHYSDTHKCRTWYFWWHRRPYASEVKAAIRHASNARHSIQAVWVGPLRRLGWQQSRSPSALVTMLRSGKWEDRFVARHTLATMGGEAVDPLRSLVQGKDKSLRRTATWLLRCIARNTTTRLKKQASRLLCSRCLVRFGRHRLRLSRRHTFTYYGCRACSQSREFLEWPGKVVAVLDAIVAEEQVERDETLRVNWIGRKKLFDFDRVEILHATGKDVERFAMQVANDKDATRRRRYGKMRCTISPGCRLSEHTLNTLRSLFRHVESQGGQAR